MQGPAFSSLGLRRFTVDLIKLLGLYRVIMDNQTEKTIDNAMEIGVTGFSRAKSKPLRDAGFRGIGGGAPLRRSSEATRGRAGS